MRRDYHTKPVEVCETGYALIRKMISFVITCVYQCLERLVSGMVNHCWAHELPVLLFLPSPPRLQQGIHLSLQEQLDRLRVVRDRGPAERSAAVTAARIDFGTTGEEELQDLRFLGLG